MIIAKVVFMVVAIFMVKVKVKVELNIKPMDKVQVKAKD